MEMMSKSFLSVEAVIDELCTKGGNALFEKYLAEKLKYYKAPRIIMDMQTANF
jgi:hypothetical protein